MSEWISVDQELPEPQTDVLAVDKNGKRMVASHDPGCTCSTKWHCKGQLPPPTHWMPLPAPPETSK